MKISTSPATVMVAAAGAGLPMMACTEMPHGRRLPRPASARTWNPVR
jgi:hypothetical protein